MVEQDAVNVKVVGSSPIAPAKNNGPCSVMVAYHTCTVMEGFEFHMCPQKLESSSDGGAA